MKIVINKCYGGFGLSEAVYLRLIELGVPVVTEYKGVESITVLDSGTDTGGHWYRYSLLGGDQIRTDPRLVQAVEELHTRGVDVNSPYADLEVIEIPDGIDWEIYEHDGMEHIAECHRSWG